jgi:NAD(P)-dependent dehydrogenase (short-subunit alcohol dehydrogenase family)
MKDLAPLLPTKSSPSFETLEADDGIKLPSHAICAIMAARVGSVSDNKTGGWCSYRSSKAAVFQLAKTLDLHLRARSGKKALAVALHPGTVRANFTRAYWNSDRHMLTPEDAARRLLQVLTGIASRFNDGRRRCWDWKEKEVVP